MTVACPLPARAVGVGGVPGGVTPGVTGPTEADAPHPAPLRADTDTVYAVPLVRPVSVHVIAGAVAVHVAPPGVATTR